MYTLQSQCLEDTMRLGESLGRILKGGEVIALTGELGAGKTVLVKGLAKGLGITDDITSPTYVLVKTYQGRLTLHHMDFYRLKNAWDLDSIGFEDYLGSRDVLALEWAEKFPGELPEEHIRISIEYAKNESRIIRITGFDDASSSLSGIIT